MPGADRVGCDGSLTANYYSHVTLYMCECTSLNLRDCLTSWVVLHEHCMSVNTSHQSLLLETDAAVCGRPFVEGGAVQEMSDYHIFHFWQRCLVLCVGFTSGTVLDSHGYVHFTVTGECRVHLIQDVWSVCVKPPMTCIRRMGIFLFSSGIPC